MRLDGEMIRRNLNVLRKGDHIQMPLQSRFLGTFLSHHAVVKEFKVENSEVKTFSVFEIPDKGGIWKKTLRVKLNHCAVEIEDITLIEYRKRKHDHNKTYERATRFESHSDSVSTERYNLFTRNCEHFASTCVNGNADISVEKFDESTSLKSAKCFWIFCDIITAVMQFVFFITNFYIYAINEPRREKTGLRGFRPGPTQTGLYSLRKVLEA